jgi:ATP-binding cassette subfamily F protein 3
MEYIRGNSLTFRYESQPEKLFENISFSLSDNDRVGLIGDNGCGKTTLLDLIRGARHPSSGNLTIHKTAVIGFLPQEVYFEERTPVGEYLWRARADLFDLKTRMAAMRVSDPRYADLVADFYGKGGDAFDAAMRKTLAGFDIAEDKLGLSISSLSGGEKTKIALARILLVKPDVMLLDEPTNHLEIASLIWLEDFLRDLPKPYIIVSHDRRFLDNCVDQVWEMHDKRLTVYSGSYSDYRDEKARQRRKQQAQYERQQEKIDRLREAARQRRDDANRMEKFKHKRSVSKKGALQKRDEGSGRGGARPTDRMRGAKAIEKRIEQMLERDKIEKPRKVRDRKISLSQSDVEGRFVLRVEHLSKSFGEHQVFEDITLSVGNGIKLGIIGRNGSGKSTLLKIIVDEIKASSGSYRWSPQVSIGYYSQEHETLDPRNTILDEVLQGQQQEQTRARTILGRLNIRRDKVLQTIRTLSIGEKSKTALAKILFSDVNVLVLDEPTNHVELSAREALEEALDDYDGTIIIASHDRYLLDRIATAIYDIEANRYFPGGYGEYIEED